MLGFQRLDRCETIDAMALRRISLDDKDAGYRAGHNGDIGIGPMAEVFANDLGVDCLAPFDAAAVFRRLVRLLLSGRRRKHLPSPRSIFKRSSAARTQRLRGPSSRVHNSFHLAATTYLWLRASYSR